MISLPRFAFPRAGQWSLIAGLATVVVLGPQFIDRLTPSPYDYPFSPTRDASITTQLTQEVTFYKARIQQNPEDGLNQAALATTYLRLARATGSDNWYLLAEQTAQQSLANLPYNNTGALLTQAKIAEARHDFDRAIELGQQVLEISSLQEDALAILITSHLAKGNLTEASQLVEQLVSRVPTQNAHTLRALVYMARGQDDQAIVSFQSALSVEEPGEVGSSVRTRTLMGRFYAGRGERVAAKQLYQEALAILPRSPQPLIYLAQLEAQSGRYRAAERLYNQVFSSQAYPNVWDHVALQGLAGVKQLQGDTAAAKQLWQQAEALFRQHEDLNTFGHRRELARLLLSRGQAADLPEALALMEADLQARRDAETLDTYAWVLTRLGRYEDAQAVLSEALKTGVRNARITHRAALVETALGNPNQASRYTQQAQAIDPTSNEQYRQLWGL
ncbi:MAG: tetratricopeptide repeat protein [Cyanobacteria bacterium J06648_16]